MRRLSVLLVLVLVLAGCSRKPAEDLLDTRAPPSLTPAFFAPDGWAWGMVRVKGFPPARYGVAAPAQVPRGQIVLLADAGEPGEAWFETVRALEAEGWTVWLLEAGATPQAGAAHLKALIDTLVRPREGEPVTVVGSGAGALAALLAAEDGGLNAGRLVLSAPLTSEPLAAKAAERVRYGLGRLPADGEHEWKRPDYDITGRAHLVEAWRTANPDLRPRKRTWAWRDARGRALTEAAAPARLAAVKARVLVLDSGGPARAICAATPACRFQALPATPLPYPFAAEAARGPWLAAILEFAANTAP